jgi:hypothetical protein
LTTKPSNPDPLAQIENAQKIIAQADASLAQLEEAKVELDHVLAGAAAEQEAITERRTIEMNALMPAGALDKALDRLDLLDKAVARRVEIASTVRPALTARLDAAREAEREVARAAEYEETEKLVSALAGRFEEFLGRTAPEARALLADCAAVQMRVSEVNRTLPPHATPIRSLEQRRTGELKTRETIVRRLRYFYRGNDRIIEVGRGEAIETSAGVWNVFAPSNSIQGGESFGGCRIVEFVEVRTETLTSHPESLISALRIPNFYEPYLSTGSSRRTIPAAEWDARNGDAEQVPLLAAE